jgi:hypothetical protein
MYEGGKTVELKVSKTIYDNVRQGAQALQVFSEQLHI